ncbi:MAG: hypothetical protein LUQ38_11365 [Methanotrichaceae archaeon]|nr:hypothetical protein [Methanotrichaceae archaeon]
MKTPEDSKFGFKGGNFRRNYQQVSKVMKRQGFLGLYHPFKGKVYAGTGINEDEDLYQAYLFGDNAIMSAVSYGEYSFKENIEKHCLEFNVNRIHGIIRPPSEGGVVNNPNDNILLEPANPPGMIQGAARFSQLARMFPQIYGLIIDDFFGNYGNAIKYEDLKNIKGALFGKKVDSSGRVDHSSSMATPHLKLFVVTYERELGSPDKGVLELIDGVNLWIYNQNGSYQQFNDYANTIKANYPGKELIAGIYIHNGDYGDMTQQSISNMLQKSIDLHEQGQVSGVLLFAGHWLVKDYISRERSIQIGLSDILYKHFYPFIGEIRSLVLDERTGKPLEKVRVKVMREISGGKMTLAQKTTNVLGEFSFSGWSGRSSGLEYWFTLEKEGYEPYKRNFVLKPNMVSDLPAVRLKALGVGKNLGYNVTVSREPASLRAIRTDRIGEGMIGDRMFPYCIAFPLEVCHNWQYSEAQILDVLSKIRFSGDQPDLWDHDEKALRCVSALKTTLKGCPCGIALGETPGPDSWRTVLIYWTAPSTWKFWDPGRRSSTQFSCRFVIG